MEIKRYSHGPEIVPDVSDRVHEAAKAYQRENAGTDYRDAVLHVLRTNKDLAKEYSMKREPEEPVAMPKTYTEAEKDLTAQAFDLAFATGLDFKICFSRVLAHPKNAGAAKKYILGDPKKRTLESAD